MNVKNFYYVIMLLILVSANSYAEEINFDQHCQGRTGNKETLNQEMCKCTSEYLKTLKKENTDGDFTNELNEINKLSNQLQILQETKNVINNFRTNLDKAMTKANVPNEVPAKINQYSRSLNQAILIKSIQSLINLNPKLIEDKKFTLGDLCVDKIFDQNKDLCSYLTKNSTFYKNAAYEESIKRFIDVYKTAIATDDPSQIQSSIEKLVANSEVTSDVDFVLKLSDTFSPELNKTISKSNDNIRNCQIKMDDKNCRSPFISISAESNKSLMEEINKNATQFQSSIASSKRNDNLKNADLKIQKIINDKIAKSYNEMSTTSLSEINARSKVYTDFFNDESLLKEVESLQGKTDVKVLDDFMELKNHCSTDTSNLSLVDKELLISTCNQQLQNIYLKFSEKPIIEANDKLAAAKENLRAKMNSNKTRSNQLLQNFVANNFLRECSSSVKVSADLVSGCGNSELSPITNFKLENDFYPIIGKVSSGTSFINKFSKDEMQEYATACNGANSAKFSLVCKIIRTNLSDIINDPVSKDWAKEREKYWISYDPKAPGGYTKTEKKGIGRMFGEALVPALMNSIPFAFQNYAAGMAIDNMEQQAKMQKQWMWDSTQANNYWMANMFYQTPTIPTMPTFTSTNSFNFGK